MCAPVTEEFETMDILVNNAGVTRDGLFRKIDARDWDDGHHHQPQQRLRDDTMFVEPMAERGWGRVINISSIVGQIGNFGQANYAAAKAGHRLTKTLAREYAKKGVTVNAVRPASSRRGCSKGCPTRH